MQRLSGELGKVKLELSKVQRDLSASVAMKRQLESEVHDLTVRCKDYEKKIVDARENVDLVVRS